MKLYARITGYCIKGGVVRALKAKHFECLTIVDKPTDEDGWTELDAKFTITTTVMKVTEEVIE